MESFNVTKTAEGLRIDGIPDAAKVVKVEGPKAKRLADLALHRSDLTFADECLEAINNSPEEPSVLRQALWRSAIVHFIKCFGSDSRFQLNSQRIYKAEPPEALIAFRYFRDLRNKHFVHDVNSYSQSLPGAVLNKGGKDYKVEKIICFSAHGSTLDQSNFSNLKLLIANALSWVISEFDGLCAMLTQELESEPYEKLIAREGLTYRVPGVGDVGKERSAT